MAIIVNNLGKGVKTLFPNQSPFSTIVITKLIKMDLYQD